MEGSIDGYIVGVVFWDKVLGKGVEVEEKISICTLYLRLFGARVAIYSKEKRFLFRGFVFGNFFEVKWEFGVLVIKLRERRVFVWSFRDRKKRF